MSDRFRKRMDKVAGRGGVKCYCCGLSKSEKTSIRMWFNRELQDEIDEALSLPKEIVNAVDENFWDLI